MSGRMAVQTACAHCGAMFYPRYNSARRYCSVRCAGLAKAKVNPHPVGTPEERAAAVEIVNEMTDALAMRRALLGEVES